MTVYVEFIERFLLMFPVIQTGMTTLILPWLPHAGT